MYNNIMILICRLFFRHLQIKLDPSADTVPFNESINQFDLNQGYKEILL